MQDFKRTLAVAIIAVVFGFSPQGWADQGESYTHRLVTKASHGFANMATGFVEIPKNVSNISSDSNIFMGLTVGVIRGVVHTVSRTLVGLGEFLTSPIPTDDYVAPGYVWERFSEDTRYFGRHYPLYWTTFGPMDEGENLRPQ